MTGEHNFRRAPHILFLTALFISIAGFLGYYDGVNFITPPSAVVLGAQLILITAAISVLRMRMFEGTARLAPLFALAIWAALTILWTDDALISTRRWLLIFVPSIGLALLAATDSRPERSFTWIKWLLIAITLGSCIFSLIIYAFGETYGIQGNRHKFERFRVLDLGGWVVGVSEGGRQYLNLNLYIHRFSGFTTNPNSFALFAALALISLCATARTKIKSGGWIEITLILITAVILAMSASRAAVAMAFAGLFIIFLLRFGQRNLARLCVTAILALTVLLYLLIVFQAGLGGGGEEEIFDPRQRADVWRLAIHAAADVWFQGLGFGMTQEALFMPLGIQTSAHSVPLSMLLETGIVGLLLSLIVWFLPVFTLTRTNTQLSNTSIAIVALLVALFVHQTVDSSVFRYHWAHFVFAYLIGASSQLAARHHNA